MKLLREYARQNSEAAFAELVCRHINLVYSAALRHVGIAAQAEEIAQAVFVILARKAASLREDQILDAWLFETTRLTALSFLRGERRRQFREQEAYMESILQESTPDPVWHQLAPLLDDAMMRLGRRDREVIVLRFFKGRSLGEVAAALNIKEPAAQKRVSRALEKLRRFFAKRGVDSTTAAIAETISANSVLVAPVALAKTISAVAITKGATAGGSTLALVKGALKIMAWAKAKTAIVAAAVVILAAGTPVVVHVVHQHEAAASIFSSKTELTDSDNANYQRLTGTTPAEVARTFFDAMSRQDWTAADKYWPPGFLKKDPTFLNTITNMYGGLEIVSIGKPFKARISIAKMIELQPESRNQFKSTTGDFEAASVFVPYEIRFKNGEVKKWQLSIRCDNPENRWYFDGGM